jgi:hypothetical protein
MRLFGFPMPLPQPNFRMSTCTPEQSAGMFCVQKALLSSRFGLTSGAVINRFSQQWNRSVWIFAHCVYFFLRSLQLSFNSILSRVLYFAQVIHSSTEPQRLKNQ